MRTLFLNLTFNAGFTWPFIALFLFRRCGEGNMWIILAISMVSLAVMVLSPIEKQGSRYTGSIEKLLWNVRIIFQCNSAGPVFFFRGRKREPGKAFHG